MPESTFSKLWSFTKGYASSVGSTFLIFVGPLLMVVLTSSIMTNCGQDKEMFGLGWLHLSAIKEDKVREEKFPSYEPSSHMQRRRNEAAKAVDYVVDTV
ncbi:hypothetical protein AGDE_00379 [Angomonas deanei]|uniref:Uncharacterized protein n=1 Tax=Angomonas deanei TaxID=59799 RepID=S9VL56_9TRYP|nr:hypothetical protein AGDE_03126 [Angomonas deanei]EPY43464.1 hypothetical protein AGDE_00457 [Angomonas deanei]EPY43542.1 hypothetical protein AGDE_00379 [Angomonas deanei]CAD2222610.1 hypothetical protein, conserved [Angomonas deanei]|eukprot:EPY40801.1 hypothetical protein AGDE_03126 [Angomonas deanei]